MPTTLTPAKLTRAGITETLAAAASGGNQYTNTGREWIDINNGSGSPITLYAATYADGQTVAHGRSWTIGAGARVKISPLPTNPYNDTSNRVQLTYSAVTSVTVGVSYR